MKKINSNICSVVQYTFVLCLFMVILVYFFLTFYIIPSIDDLYFNAATRDLGIGHVLKEVYQSINGRYFSMALLSACGIRWGSAFDLILCERWMGAIFFIAFVAAIFFLIQSMTLRMLSLTTASIYTLLFLAVFCLAMPAPSAQFYWIASVTTHLTAMILMLLLLSGLLNEMFIQEYKYSGLNYPIAILLAGTSEPIIITTAVLILLGLSLNKFARGQLDSHWIKIGVCLALFTTVALLSPGNEARVEISRNYSEGLPIGYALRYLVRYSVQLFPKWIFNGVFILSSLYLFFDINKASGVFAKVTFKHVGLAIITWLLLIFISPLMVALSINAFILRYWNVTCFIFLLGWYINLSLFKLALINHGYYMSWANKIKPFMMILIIFFVLSDFRFLFTANELINQAPLYSQKMHQRFEKIILSLGDTVMVDEIPPQAKARSLIYNEISTNPACLYNYNYEKFFNKKSIYLLDTGNQLVVSQLPCDKFLKLKGY